MKPSAEASILLLSEQSSFDRAAFRDALDAPLDWDAVTALARAHLTYPRLSIHLATHAADVVPPDILSKFQSLSATNSTKALQFAVGLVEILNILKEQQIQAVPFKGVALALAAYGNIAARNVGDIDLLLHKQDVRQAVEALQACGFENLLPDGKRDRALTKHYHVPLQNAAGIRTELHWTFTSQRWSIPLHLHDLAKRQTQLVLLGNPIPTLSPEDLLIILSIHGCKHLWTRLCWITDISALIQSNPEMDWKYIIDTAKQYGCMRVLLTTLNLAYKLLGVPLAQSIHFQIASDQTAIAVCDYYIQGLFNPIRSSLKSDESYLYLRMRERLMDKILVYYRFNIETRGRDWLRQITNAQLKL